jgi:UDPglucose 6-dehydrogenase
MVNPEMVMIGTEDGSTTGDAKQLVDFYKTIMENEPRYEIGTWDECECIKVFYNTFISAKIGLVNMIQDVAEIQGNIDVDVVTNALAKSTKRIMGPQYMTAGMGDGGGCHPRDNIALRYMAQELDLGYDLFDSIMNAREMQAQNLAITLVDIANEKNMPIYIHGKAYKPGVPYTDGSYSLLVGHYCAEYDFEPTYIDPLTGDDNRPEEPCVMLLAHSASTTYKYMQEEGDDTDKLYCDIPNNSVVVDPWRKYTNDNCEVRHYGNTRNV